MTTLQLRFPNQTISISQIPEHPISIVSTCRHKRITLLKAADGSLYSPALGSSKGIGICDWYSYRAFDFLPSLHRLRLMPKGCSIKLARRLLAAEQKAFSRHRAIIELRQSCQRLGIKTPRIPKLKAK